MSQPPEQFYPYTLKATPMKTVTYVKWMHIYEHPDYFISNNGMVKGPRGLMIIKWRGKIHKYGYVIIYYNNTKARYDIHRLVWDHFGDGNKPTRQFHIHHKDFNSMNNHISNLMLMDYKGHFKAHKEKVYL